MWLLSRVALIPLRAFVCVATIQGGPYSTQSFCLCGYYPGWPLFLSELLFVWLLSRVALIPLRAFVCVATIQGGPYSAQSFCLCGYYSRVASKYGMQSWY